MGLNGSISLFEWWRPQFISRLPAIKHTYTHSHPRCQSRRRSQETELRSVNARRDWREWLMRTPDAGGGDKVAGEGL